MTGDGIDDVCATGELCDIPSVPVDCNKALLCVQERCVCNDTSCFAAEETSQELILRRTATGLTGAFNNTLFLNERGLLISLGTVRFRAAD
jgi:hypothetical protein